MLYESHPWGELASSVSECTFWYQVLLKDFPYEDMQVSSLQLTLGA